MTPRAPSPFLLLLAAGLLAGLSGCRRAAAPAPAAGDAPPSLVPVIFQTNWYAEADHGGYYQALARGFYREAGLDVTIHQGGPGAFPVQKVATGQAHFALSRSDEIILAIQEKIPVVNLCAQLQHDPQIIIVHDSSPVRGFADLDGRAVMMETGAPWQTYVEKKFGIRIKSVPVNYGLGSFLADPSFIQQAFLTNETFILHERRVPFRLLLISDSGYDPYRTVFGNTAYVKAHPDVARAFVRASIRGWADYLHGDPAPGDALIARDHAANTPELLRFAREKMAEHRIADGDPAKGDRLGLLTRKRLAEQLAILADIGLLTTPVSVDQAADFGALPDELRPLAD